MRSLVLGHRGLVGQALDRKLRPCAVDRDRLQYSDHIYLAAARVGGIGSNVEQPADFFTTNMAVQMDVIAATASFKAKLLFLGSSCIYPAESRTHGIFAPFKEDDLMAGPLEPTNSAYAMAKLAGLEMCKAYAKQYGLRYVALMPCNLYGPGRPNDTHVVNMLMRRFHEAKLASAPVVSVWGTGRPLRELMHVDDMAEAAVHFMNLPEAEGQLINVGTGSEISIHALATTIAEIVGYNGDIEFDHTKPDGVYRKVMDSSKANGLGWRPTIGLVDGLKRTYDWYVNNGGWP